MKANWRNILLYLLIILTGIALIAPMFQSEPTEKKISFSEFLDFVDQGKVKDVTIAGQQVTGQLTDKTKFKTRAISYPKLVPELRERGVSIKVDAPVEANWAWNLAIQLLIPVAFFGLLWWFLIRQAQG